MPKYCDYFNPKPTPESSGLGAGAIAGIVVGTIAGVGGICGVAYWCLVVKKAVTIAAAAPG
jgi:hypothetical protein